MYIADYNQIMYVSIFDVTSPHSTKLFMRLLILIVKQANFKLFNCF